MRRAQVRAAVIYAAVLAGTSCSSTTAASQGTFRQVAHLEVASFNPYRNATGAYYSSYLYDSLVNITPTNEITSGLAQAWTSTPTSAVFTLRSDVTCSDGTPLRPSDVAAALNYLRDPQRAAVVVANLATVPPFTASADDEAHTVTIRLDRPHSFITRLLGAQPIVCPKGLADPGTLDKASVGTGPYVLARYASGGPYTFTLRKGYRWGPGGASTDASGMPEKIVLSVVPSGGTAINQLITGEVDAVMALGPDSARTPGSGFTRVEQPAALGTAWFNERTDRVTSDPVVRKALVAGLNPDQMAAVISGGRGKSARSLMFPVAFCAGDTVVRNRPRYDLAAARQMLDQAGWVPGADGIRTRSGRRLAIKIVTFASNLQFRSTTEFMAGEWAKLGVAATVDAVTDLAFSNVVLGGSDWDVSLLGGVTGSLPSTLVPFFSGATPPRGLNAGAVDNPDYTRLTQQALAAPDRASCPLWQQAEVALISRVDTVVFAESAVVWLGNQARFEVAATTSLIPTSIRLLR